ncbi:MAG: hypothetical protein JWM52_459 [Candidatus Saccharibacteria bacterium]|nr:hypothetical protein [Candidatus Saccharibacteria bacterium]
MFPNQPEPQVPPQPTPLPVPSSPDYLNQIAPQAPKKDLFKIGPKLILLVIGVLILLVAIMSFAFNTANTAKKKPLETLSARLTTTETIATAAQSNLKSSELRSLNSNLKIYLTNTNRDVAAPLLAAGVDVKKLSKTITTAEAPDAINARLEDARLNAIYDRTYAREMAYQLDTLITLMKQIYKSTSSTKLKEFLQATFDSLEPTQKSFEDFNAANG